MKSAKGTAEYVSQNLTDSQVCEVLDTLKNMYPDAECALNHGSVYQLLVAVALSAQTTDVSVNKVTPALFAKYPDSHSLSLAADKDFEGTVSEVSELIRKIGMYKTKAKNIVKLSQMLEKTYHGVVPEDFDSLITLSGVGRKTANVVLAVGFGHQTMPVDTHVLRVSHRIGLASEKSLGNPDATEQELIRIIPENRLTEAHHSLIFHGRRCCIAQRPKCIECGIARYCCFFALNQKN